jgi:hypothetical protein
VISTVQKQVKNRKVAPARAAEVTAPVLASVRLVERQLRQGTLADLEFPKSQLDRLVESVIASSVRGG